MRVREFEALVVDLLTEADHPEILSVQRCADDARDTTHNRLKVNFASGASATVMVREVTGPGLPRHAPFELPKEAM
jgi:hypothetical protein